MLCLRDAINAMLYQCSTACAMTDPVLAVADPSPFLYNDALYAAAGLISLAAVSNLMMRPVDPKFHMKA